DLTDLVAVLTSERGTRRLIDRAGTEITVRTSDLAEGEQLDQYLTHVLRRVPHLSVEEDGPRRHHFVRRRSQRRWMLIAVAILLVAVGGPFVLDRLEKTEETAGAGGSGLEFTPGPEDAWSLQHLRW